MLHQRPGIILLRGGGDIATGIALRLYRAGFRRLIILETARPLAVRRRVALCEAVYEGYSTVEGVTAAFASDRTEVQPLWDAGCIPVLIDELGISVSRFRPDVVIEATLAKRNVGVELSNAPLVIGVGPGFTVGFDVHRVIETSRGHFLGRVLTSGSAAPDSGIPGVIGGFSTERIIRSPQQGIFFTELDIGDRVCAGDLIALVKNASEDREVRAAISGVLRGLLRSGTPVTKGLKSGDIDPRDNIASYLVSDKALAIGGGVLEAILERFNRPSPLQRGVLQIRY